MQLRPVEVLNRISAGSAERPSGGEIRGPGAVLTPAGLLGG